MTIPAELLSNQACLQQMLGFGEEAEKSFNDALRLCNEALESSEISDDVRRRGRDFVTVAEPENMLARQSGLCILLGHRRHHRVQHGPQIRGLPTQQCLPLSSQPTPKSL